MKAPVLQRVQATDQPCERLVQYGEKALSDYELLAILLRTGTQKMPVLTLATELLHHFGGLFSLKNATLEELQAVHGIGRAGKRQTHASPDDFRSRLFPVWREYVP